MTSQTECAINFSTGFGTPPSFILEQVLVMPKAACYRYRSQNGFGGMNREYAVYPRGASGMLIDNPSAWNRYCANQEGDDATAAIKMLLHIVE